jgi:hypothetical protein
LKNAVRSQRLPFSVAARWLTKSGVTLLSASSKLAGFDDHELVACETLGQWLP